MPGRQLELALATGSRPQHMYGDQTHNLTISLSWVKHTIRVVVMRTPIFSPIPHVISGVAQLKLSFATYSKLRMAANWNELVLRPYLRFWSQHRGNSIQSYAS